MPTCMEKKKKKKEMIARLQMHQNFKLHFQKKPKNIENKNKNKIPIAK